MNGGLKNNSAVIRNYQQELVTALSNLLMFASNNILLCYFRLSNRVRVDVYLSQTLTLTLAALWILKQAILALEECQGHHIHRRDQTKRS